MPRQVSLGASLRCSFGTAPSTLLVPPVNKTLCDGPPAATIMDHKPFVNLLPFAMCQSPSNPTVAAATSAAAGVLTPMPCIPVTPAPWTPGSSQVLINNQPALNDSCQCSCLWGGQISVDSPAGESTELP